MIRIGPAGIPLSCKGRTNKDGLVYIKKQLNLDAMEIQFVRGLYVMEDEEAQLIKDFSKEKKSLLESLALCEDIGDQDGIALAYNNLGEMSIQKGDFDEAIQYAEKGLAIGHQIGEEWTIIVSLNNLGEAYLGLGDLNLAMDYLRQAICMANEIESMDMVTRAAVNIGKVILKQGKRELAWEWLQATIVHSAIEYEHQQKAIRILKESNV